MRPPCELVTRNFLPTVRARTAIALRNKGLSQSEIARKMDITQAAVSKYLNQPTSATREDDTTSALAQKLADMMASESCDIDETTKAVCSACMHLRLGSTICQSHRKAVPRLKQADCQICSELLGGREPTLSGHAQVLADMDVALREIEASDHFALLMPQVRANLVACDANATSDADVAGVPGRITLVDGRAVAHEGPQFGASRHTAQLLLWAKDQWPRTRACLCVSGRDDIVRAAEIQGFFVYRTSNPATEAQAITESASEVVREYTGMKSLLPAVHVPGGIGVEPILYLFGPSATELSKDCVRISEEAHRTSAPLA